MTRQFGPWLLRGAIGLALVAGLLATAGAALAAGGPLYSLPQVGVKNKNGLVISFDGRGVDGNGYRPVRIEVTPWPVKPLAADRQIRLVLRPRSYNATGTPQVTQIIDLPEGSTSVKATISIPQSALWYSLSIETYEGGELLEDLSQEHMPWNNTNYWDWTEERPAMLFIHSAVPPRPARDLAVQNFRSTTTDPSPTYNLPDVRTLVNLFPDPNRGMPTGAVADVGSPTLSDTTLLYQVVDMSRVEMLPPTELPDRWIDLSQCDVVTISFGDLQALADKQPAKFAALRQWLSTGPLLNVFDAGADFERLAAIEKLFDLAALPAVEGAHEYRGWTAPDSSVKKHELLSAWEEADYAITRYPGGGYSKAKRASPKSLNWSPATVGPAPVPGAASANLAPPFVFRRAGLGCVVAIAAKNPFPGKESDWIWLLNSVPDSHWKWFRRGGFSMHRTNDDYWTFLIPGVGEAPVVSFLLLVSLFAIVIGPVNYIFLGRSRRLYLLLLTVPAGATVVTLCLFTYALLTDGLGVRLRARSFTELDQRTGQAAAWSWQSYYAAIAPSEGLVFPEDTTVFPIEHQPSAFRDPNGVSGKLRWDEGQHLTAGYLKSRTAAQFMTQRATKSAAKLVVREGKSAGQPPEVQNLLGADVRYLLLRDSRGEYYGAQKLGAEQTVTLTRVDPAAAERELRKLADAVAPDLPRGYDPDIHNNNALSFLNPAYNWGGVDGSAAQPVMASSLLERSLAECTLPTKVPLDPQTYTAIVESSPAVPIGVPRVRQEASLHVIRGRY